MSDNSEIIKKTILRQLSYGICSRSHLHRECCIALGKRIKKITKSGYCEGISDYQFDKQFNILIDEKHIQKTPYYELTETGKKLLEDSS